jgi:hypothetical protein
MRLSTLNQQLAKAFSSTFDAASLFQQVFWKSYETFDVDMKRELEGNKKLAILAEHQIPTSSDLASMSEGFDELYFDLEDEGDLVASGRCFQKARITAAMAQAAKASNNVEFSEAAYEALMATDNPQALSAELVSQVS